MTPQEIFDKAYRGLKKQGKPSRLAGSGNCKYSSPDGLHCGVGFLVSDEVGKLWDQGKVTSIDNIVKNNIVGVETWMKGNLELLQVVQKTHDNIREWDNPQVGFEASFFRIACLFNLTVPTAEIV